MLTIRRTLLLIASILFVVGFEFHKQFATGFELVLGNRFDAIIEASILEHWYNVFSGVSNWKEVAYFFPYENTLGYNDGYFLYGVIFSIFRVMGFDILISSELLNVSLKIIGFLSFFVLCRKMKLNYYCALAGAIIFTLSNSLVIQARHAQLFSVAFAPLLTLLLFSYLKGMLIKSEWKETAFYGCVSSCLLSAWLLTSFYMAWYYLLFCAVFIFITLLLFTNKSSKYSVKNISLNWLVLLLPALTFFITIIPFLIVYLPKLKETHGQSLDAVMHYMPGWYNLIDPGSESLLYGSLSNVLFDAMGPAIDRGTELSTGFPPGIWIVALLSTLTMFFYIKRDEKFRFPLAFLLTFFICISMMIKVDGWSLWEYVWRYVPGAKGVRVVSRFGLFLIFPLTLGIVIFLSLLNIKKYQLSVSVLLLFLIFEQVNLFNPADLNRVSYLKGIQEIPTPPAGCKVFYVTGKQHEIYPKNISSNIISLYPHNVDALFIAEYFRVRTINGFSTFNPPDWDFSSYPESTYISRVYNYVNKHNLQNDICRLDLNMKKWFLPDVSKPFGLVPLTNDQIKINKKSDPLLTSNEKEWIFSIEVENNSDEIIGEGSIYPLNLGVRILNDEGSVLKQDFKRVPLPYMVGHSSRNLVINIPASELPGGKIDILPVQEGIGWLDINGVKPLIMVLK